MADFTLEMYLTFRECTWYLPVTQIKDREEALVIYLAQRYHDQPFERFPPQLI